MKTYLAEFVVRVHGQKNLKSLSTSVKVNRNSTAFKNLFYDRSITCVARVGEAKKCQTFIGLTLAVVSTAANQLMPA